MKSSKNKLSITFLTQISKEQILSNKFLSKYLKDEMF